ncbi:hypothetical protein [Micromonospora sp. ATA51]|uniref:hypothetical protein n=1 Tax=Micromonospora sp. ATA51 TaxID=2806098 RepID=UPI001EE3EBC5|nr:hypothetical protein [Micromonospora sp. ATA51]
MRVLVTGASGRLGRVVLPTLLGEGFAVRAMSRHGATTPGWSGWWRTSRPGRG